MYKFNYQKVSSIKEAEKLLNEDEEAKIIAGGQTLIPTMKQRLASPSVLIDIGGISDLNFINANRKNILRSRMIYSVVMTITESEIKNYTNNYCAKIKSKCLCIYAIFFRSYFYDYHGQ